MSTRTRVKICGVTDPDDALLAAELGADAVGFVFADGSRRRADPHVVRGIVEALPPFVTAVGVFRNQPLTEIRAVVERCGLHLVQLHGDENALFARALGHPVLKAIGIGGEDDLAVMDRFPDAEAFLLDTRVGDESGGTGQTFDWTLAERVAVRARVVLAGGLDALNVGDAIRRVRPWAVDGCSGTEAEPGRKDPEKLRAFFAAVRQADATPQS